MFKLFLLSLLLRKTIAICPCCDAIENICHEEEVCIDNGPTFILDLMHAKSMLKDALKYLQLNKYFII